MGENKVPLEDLDAMLREIVARHLTLLKQAELSTDNDPRVAALRKQAVAAIEVGDYISAEGFLQRAFDASLVAGRQIQDAANKRLLSAAEIRAQVGELNVTQLRYAAAARDFQEAANLVPSEEPLVRSDYLNRLGLAADRVGDYPLAEAALAEALSIRERMLDPQHLDLAVSLNNLAELYRAQGQYDKAEPLYVRAIAISEKMAGREHADVAKPLNNLGILYQNRRRYTEAEQLLRRALTISEKELGPENSDVAIGLNNLAELYSDEGRYAEAEPLFQRALAISEKVLGLHHPDVTGGLNNLAKMYSDQGRYAEAEAKLRTCQLRSPFAQPPILQPDQIVAFCA